jgi:site-specific DNA recombinase
MGRRAVIYVRTSSEQQGEKCSPVEQEADCRQLADKQGLVVVNVYRDIERYRVKNKWVEPSGTRYDRPGLLAMLRDAADDQFDVILAWREDRLYRGMRAMLLVLETVQQHKLEVQLAMDTFDPTTAPLKAWLAQVELDNIKERMTMGVKARLKAGKANSGQDRYGYKRVGEKIEVFPEEAEWVRQIFTWYIERVPLKIIRKRLLTANAPQKTAIPRRKVPWSIHSIEGILAGGREYATGIKIQSRGGDHFEIRTEPIIGMETYEASLKIRRKPNNSPPSSVIQYALIRGLLYCDCGYCWQPHDTYSHYRNSNGEWVKRKKITGVYVCGNKHDEFVSPQCPRKISRIDADREVWRQVCSAINHPEILLDNARILVDELRTEVETSQTDRERILKELENLFLDRQWTITRARKGIISEDEMELTLNEYSKMEVSLKNELSSMQKTIDERLLVDWEGKVRQFLDDLKDGIEGLNVEPADEQEWFEAFELKHHIVQLLVERVAIDIHRQLTVTIHLNLFKLLEDSLKNNGDSGESGTWPVIHPLSKPNISRKASLFQGRSGYVKVSAIWNS